jgi:alpha-L-glutamate ligase-like protein
MNRRNAVYILPHNPRRHYARLDDKLRTKQICETHGIAVPQTYAVIARQGDVRRIAELVGTREEFVVKPAQGSEGRGILVISQRRGDHWITASGQEISRADMHYHVSAVLAGLYSLGGRPDRVLIEERIARPAALAGVTVGGTPDVRVIVYRNVPAMAMIRLPTQASRGRANLHQGAVAAGIDLATGRTLGGVHQSRVIDHHPDTGERISGLTIPHWSSLLRSAIRLARCLEMGYLGVDFVLADGEGPIVLEANARPGLAIQLANRCGLVHRLTAIDAHLAQCPAHDLSQASPERELGLVARIATT